MIWFLLKVQILIFFLNKEFEHLNIDVSCLMYLRCQNLKCSAVKRSTICSCKIKKNHNFIPISWKNNYLDYLYKCGHSFCNPFIPAALYCMDFYLISTPAAVLANLIWMITRKCHVIRSIGNPRVSGAY